MLELMIVIAVIAITLAWAIPSYQDSVRKARRGDAQSKMREAEVCAARSFTVNSDFDSVATDCDPDPDDKEIHYSYTIVDSATGYTVTATPQDDQAEDKCGTMTMSQTGATTPAIEGCWLSGQTTSS